MFKKDPEEKYLSFYQFINDYSDNNLNDTLKIDLDYAFYYFMTQNTPFFKGKASHSILFKNYPISLAPPPKLYSAISEQFLVFNKNSTIEPEILAEVGLALTSKEIQLIRAEHFGSIPTFDLLNEKDSESKSFCDQHREICDTYKRLKKFRFKDLIDTKYAPALIEGRMLFPNIIRIYFLSGGDINLIKYLFENFWILFTHEMGIYGTLSYLFIAIYISFLIMIIVLTYKYRAHPYLKIISPIFCIFIIIGYIFNVINTLMLLPPYSDLKNRVSYICEAIVATFTRVPMILVTYRIFRVLKSSIYMKSITNKDLLIGFGILLILVLIYKTTVATINDFYYLAYGYINEDKRRFPIGYYDNYEIYDRISIYYIIIVSV